MNYFLYLCPRTREKYHGKIKRIVLAEHDLNNKWLADKLGKDQATISKWVTNTTQPSLEALIAIANALEVPVQELVRLVLAMPCKKEEDEVK